MTILRAKITKTIAAKTEVIPPDWSRSMVAGMPSRVKMGRIQAYQPLSVRKGAFRRLRIREVNQATTRAIRTITASVFPTGDLMNLSIIITCFDVLGLESLLQKNRVIINPLPPSKCS
jgi:hypothetical protein